MPRYKGMPEEAKVISVPRFKGMPSDSKVIEVPKQEKPATFGAGIRLEKPAPPKKPDYSGAFDDTSLINDIVAGFGSGLVNFGSGIDQAASAIGGDVAGLADKYLGVGGGASKYFKDRETQSYKDVADNRTIMGELKKKYGSKGVGNPISWAEFSGEAAPWMALPAGRAVGAARTGLPSAGRLSLEGMTAGAIGGATVPLTEDESRLTSTIVGTGGGAILPPVAKLGGKIARGAGKKAKNWMQEAAEKYSLSKENPAKFKELYETGPLVKALDEPLRVVAPRTTAEAKSPVVARQLAKDDAGAVIDIARLRDDIPMIKEEGRLPESQEELLNAAEQGKQVLIDKITQGYKLATDKEIFVDMKPIIGKLRKAINDPKLDKSQRESARRIAEEIEEDINKFGQFSPDVAAARLANMYNKMKKIFKGDNSSGDSVEVIALAANNLKQQLNDTMEKVDIPEFAEMRKAWGRLNGLEKRVLKGYERRANKNSNPRVSMLDVIGYQQLMYGNIFQSIGTQGLRLFRDIITSPDPKVRKMFRLVDQNMGKERIKLPSLSGSASGSQLPKRVKDPSTGGQTLAQPGKRTRHPIPPEPQPKTVRDPSTGGQTLAQQGRRTRIPTRQSPPEPSPATVTDPSTGGQTLAQPGKRTRHPMSFGPPEPQPKTVRDPSTGGQTLAQPPSKTRIPVKPGQKVFPGLESYFEPMVGHRIPRVPNIKPGAIYKGWKYTGGNPSNPENWIKP